MYKYTNSLTDSDVLNRKIAHKRIDNYRSEAFFSVVRFAFKSTKSYLSNMIHASKYIIHEHKTWATEMAKSATYAILGGVSSFGSGVVIQYFWYEILQEMQK